MAGSGARVNACRLGRLAGFCNGCGQRRGGCGGFGNPLRREHPQADDPQAIEGQGKQNDDDQYAASSDDSVFSLNHWCNHNITASALQGRARRQGGRLARVKKFFACAKKKFSGTKRNKSQVGEFA